MFLLSMFIVFWGGEAESRIYHQRKSLVPPILYRQALLEL